MNSTKGASDVQGITDQRAARYGDFRGHAAAAQAMKQVVSDSLASNPLYAAMPVSDQMIVKEGLDMILHKIGRIVNGDPTYDDSWVDIEGYSKITRERICKQERT